MNKLRIVLDTNVLLVSISSKSKYHWIYQLLINGKFNLLLSNEILTEYDEIISTKYNNEVSKDVINTLLTLPNILKKDVFYNWRLIQSDLDDNKFADCAINGNADYLVTNDKHFSIFKNITFPYIKVINIKEFKNITNLK